MKKEVESYLLSAGKEEHGLGIPIRKWLTGDEVVAILGISKRTLQSYRDKLVLPFAQIGRKIYYKSTDIDAYLEAHYVKASYGKGGLS